MSADRDPLFAAAPVRLGPYFASALSAATDRDLDRSDAAQLLFAPAAVHVSGAPGTNINTKGPRVNLFARAGQIDEVLSGLRKTWNPYPEKDLAAAPAPAPAPAGQDTLALLPYAAWTSLGTNVVEETAWGRIRRNRYGYARAPLQMETIAEEDLNNDRRGGVAPKN